MSSPEYPIPDVSVKAIVDRFSQYSSTTIATIILLAAKIEIQQKKNGLLDNISPSRLIFLIIFELLIS